MTIHFDGGDVDHNGHWYMNEVSCLSCRAEVTACLQVAHPVSSGDVVLACVECGEELTPGFDHFSGVAVV